MTRSYNFDQISQCLPNFTVLTKFHNLDFLASQDALEVKYVASTKFHNSDNANNADNADTKENADSADNADNAYNTYNADNADNADNLYYADNLDNYFTIQTRSTIRPFFQ